MAARSPQTRPLGRAPLARHRLFVTALGFASIRPDRRAAFCMIWRSPTSRRSIAQAGGCRTVVQNALRHARALGLLTIESGRGPARRI